MLGNRYFLLLMTFQATTPQDMAHTRPEGINFPDLFHRIPMNVPKTIPVPNCNSGFGVLCEVRNAPTPRIAPKVSPAAREGTEAEKGDPLYGVCGVYRRALVIRSRNLRLGNVSTSIFPGLLTRLGVSHNPSSGNCGSVHVSNVIDSHFTGLESK